jgi:TPR repeat protein
MVQLDADELEMLLKRGKEFLADGDLASARLLLRRAAEGGSAEAALVLGTTFDPLVIQRLGVLGAHPDIGEARHWYQRAAELGSNTASQRLARLTAAP